MIRPNEVYNLAAETENDRSMQFPLETVYLNGNVAVHLYEIIKDLQIMSKSPIKVFQANSVELFKGCPVFAYVNENTMNMHPKTPYGLGKILAYWGARFYRETYGLYICSGILSNTESKLRRSCYVTKKICNYAKTGDYTNPLVIGNPNTCRDWIHACDVVDAIKTIMSQHNPDDYIISSGKLNSIHDIITNAFQDKVIRTNNGYSMNGKQIIYVDDTMFHRSYETSAGCFIYENNKLKNLGWNPRHDLKSIVRDMMGS
jgi:GDPmannose 4,6-dehydratase